jgi:hypothetical protein
MKKVGAVLPQCILLLFILVFFSGPDVFCQTSGQSSLIAAAKKEGQVVWYATLNISDSNAEMHPSKLKIAAIDPSVGEELTKYSKEFRQIYFP